MSDYQVIAKDYDYLFPKEEVFKQKSFFETLINVYSLKSCLDCACGTGWHLKMLQQLGLDCYGSDISEEMLQLAKNNLKGQIIPLKREDFRLLKTSWDKKFDLVICMTTSFPHMLNDSDAAKALESMYDRLSDKGILVIDNGFSDYFLNYKPKLIPAKILPDRAFYFFLEYVKTKKVIFNILEIIKTKDSFDHLFESITYNAMKKKDLERYFSKTLFSKQEYYGDFNFTPYSKKESKRLIVVAQK